MMGMAPALGVSQIACRTSCSLVRGTAPCVPSLTPSSKWATSRKRALRVRAAEKVEECNDEECAPAKEVGKLSMGWEAEERTKVTGTFPPVTKKKWTGYVEKDTAGQTNIYSVEPTMYVADSAISSNSSGTSSEGSDNNLAIAGFLSLIAIASASSVLISVTKNAPVTPEAAVGYTGPTLSYYISKFTPQPDPVPEVVEAVQAAPEIISSPEVEVEPSAGPLEITAPVESTA